jgi:uncharacterized protein (DUF2236 family)
MNGIGCQPKSETVGDASLERELAQVHAAASDPLAGVFGSRSVTWKVDREAAIFLGAGRALLLQLAHPWVSAAIEQHSHALSDPIGRFHRTFSVMFSLIFGSLDQSLNAARRLHHRHAAIEGRLPRAAGRFMAGSAYCANAIPALLWVHATLIETAVLAYELMLPQLTLSEREYYYSESRLLAALFGIPDEWLPRDWAAFSHYIATMVQSDTLSVTEQTQVMARQLLHGPNTWLQTPSWYQALTAALLPTEIRDAFGFRGKPAEVRQLIGPIRAIYPFLPARLRYVGPYQEAEQRLAGKARPDVITRMCNRIWIGSPELPT